MADDGYDPRFDPAFQRGFDGETAFSPQRAPINRAGARQAALPTPERIVAPMPAELRPRASVEQPRVPDDELRSSVHRAPLEYEPRAELPPVQLRSNPFLIAALVIAIALIGAGVLVGSRIDLWYSDVSSDGPGFGLLSMLVYGGPLAIILGIATVIAVLIILALRWRGRSEE